LKPGQHVERRDQTVVSGLIIAIDAKNFAVQFGISRLDFIGERFEVLKLSTAVASPRCPKIITRNLQQVVAWRHLISAAGRKETCFRQPKVRDGLRAGADRARKNQRRAQFVEIHAG